MKRDMIENFLGEIVDRSSDFEIIVSRVRRVCLALCDDNIGTPTSLFDAFPPAILEDSWGALFAPLFPLDWVFIWLSVEILAIAFIIFRYYWRYHWYRYHEIAMATLVSPSFYFGLMRTYVLDKFGLIVKDLFKPNQRIFVAGSSNEPTALLAEVQSMELPEHLEFIQFPLAGFNTIDFTQFSETSNLTTFFMTPSLRQADPSRLHFLPMQMRSVYDYLKQGVTWSCFKWPMINMGI